MQSTCACTAYVNVVNSNEPCVNLKRNIIGQSIVFLKLNVYRKQPLSRLTIMEIKK